MSSRPILITGAAGYLGRAVVASAPLGAELHLVRRRTPLPPGPPPGTMHTLDLADTTAVERLFARARPELVIHMAATMAPGELELSVVRATANVVAACAATGAFLLHLSTDAVFDGEHAPYREEDLPSPVHPYGRAKAQAEALVRGLPAGSFCIVRTSLITGTEPLDPRSSWVAESIRTGEPITLFVDELRCPVWRDDLAAALWEVADLKAPPPVLHIAGPEALSRYALGLLIATHAGLLAGRLSIGYNRDLPHPRPRDVRLDTRLASSLLRRRFLAMSELFTSGARGPAPDDPPRRPS